jgi:hypothetical protein
MKAKISRGYMKIKRRSVNALQTHFTSLSKFFVFKRAGGTPVPARSRIMGGVSLQVCKVAEPAEAIAPHSQKVDAGG